MRGCGRTTIPVLLGLSMVTAAKAATIDGSLDSSGYGSVLTTQTNVSNGRGAQLGNAYAQVDTVTNKLNLFIGGSLQLANNGPDQQLVLAIQTNSSGVSGLDNITSLAQNDGGAGDAATGLTPIGFDAGFKPNALFTFKFDGGRESDYFNLTTNTHVGYGFNANPTVDDSGVQTRSAANAPTYTIAVDNTNKNTQLTASQLAAATTGAEFQFDLAALGYTGGDINVLAFVTEGSFKQMTNQVLAPYTPNPNAPNQADYVYIDGNRQFDNDLDYGGNQYFTITVPEPASLGALGAFAVTLLRRRR